MIPIQTYLENAGKYACLALCYIMAVQIKVGGGIDEEKALDILYKAWVAKEGIDAEFFCNNPIRLMSYTAKQYGVVIKANVAKGKCNDRTELCALCYEYNGKQHFTLLHGDNEYDTLEHSVTRAYGKVTSTRIIDISN